VNLMPIVLIVNVHFVLILLVKSVVLMPTVQGQLPFVLLEIVPVISPSALIIFTPLP